MFHHRLADVAINRIITVICARMHEATVKAKKYFNIHLDLPGNCQRIVSVVSAFARHH